MMGTRHHSILCSIFYYVVFVWIGSCCYIPLLVHGWIPSPSVVSSPLFVKRSNNNQRSTLQHSSTTENDESDNKINFKDKDVYQRVFYRFSDSAATVLPDYDALVVEEIVKFEPVGDKIQPVGRRTLLLRDGKVDDGEIGDILYKLEVHDGMANHNGAGMNRDMEATIGMILYLAANPNLLEANVLELSCELGLAGLLGSIGASAALQKEKKEQSGAAAESDEDEDSSDDDKEDKDDDDEEESKQDILTIPKQSSVPGSLKMLFLSDPREDNLSLALQNVQACGLSGNYVSLGPLDWSHKAATKNKGGKEYHTILASNLDMTFLEAKELARTVAYRLEPSSTYHTSQVNNYVTIPCFVYLAPDYESSKTIQDLRRFMEKGYKMTVATDFIKLEKIMFHIQTLPQGEDMAQLDELDLEVQEYKENIYKSFIAYQSPEYNSGMGEFFFPMETGAFDNDGGSGGMNPYLEPDPSGSY